MIRIKLLHYPCNISDYFITDDFYKFIISTLHTDNIYVFGEKFLIYMKDLFIKSQKKDYSLVINELPSILSC